MPKLEVKSNKIWIEMDIYPIEINKLYEFKLNTFIKYHILKNYIESLQI